MGIECFVWVDLRLLTLGAVRSSVQPPPHPCTVDKGHKQERGQQAGSRSPREGEGSPCEDRTGPVLAACRDTSSGQHSDKANPCARRRREIQAGSCKDSILASRCAHVLANSGTGVGELPVLQIKCSLHCLLIPLKEVTFFHIPSRSI